MIQSANAVRRPELTCFGQCARSKAEAGRRARAAISPGDIVSRLVDIAFGHHGRIHGELEPHAIRRVGDVDDPPLQPEPRIEEIDIPSIVGDWRRRRDRRGSIGRRRIRAVRIVADCSGRWPALPAGDI